MSDSENQPNKVGYKKPPEHSKWKKGQSGNPTGKKSKRETLHEIMQRLIGQEIVVHKNGAQMSMTQGEAMLTAIFGKAMKGDLASVKFLIERCGFDPKDFNPTNADRSVEMDEAAIAVLAHHADWVAIVEDARARCGEAEPDAVDMEDHDEDASL